MKITIPMPSRGRPAGLLSVLTALDALATGEHEIHYIPIIDDDDDLSIEYLDSAMRHGTLPGNTHIRNHPRTGTLQSRVNAAMREFPADVYCPLPDDGHPLTQHWDKFFAVLAADQPAFAWQELNDPGNATFIALSDRWHKVATFPEYFPFWFGDTWVLEVYLLAFAKGLPIVNQLSMGGKRGKTQGMRDLAFWFDFFARTRSERIKEAVRLAKAFGFTLDLEQRNEHLEILKAGSAAQMAKVKNYEITFGADKGEPSEAYLAAKKRAEKWIEEN